MKRTYLGILGVGLFALAGLGAGCVSSGPPRDQACQWFAATDLSSTIGSNVSSTVQSAVNAPHHVCTYRNSDGKILLQVSDDTATVDQYVTGYRNFFPTAQQPQIEQNVGVGDSSAIMYLGVGSYSLYFRTGAHGYLLSNIANASLSQQDLINLGNILATRMK